MMPTFVPSLTLTLLSCSIAYSGSLTFTPIALPGDPGYTGGLRINNAGQIVGSYGQSGGVHGYILDHGVYTTIDAPGAANTYLDGINNSGQIVGSGITAGFLLNGGTFSTITAPGERFTYPQAINDSGLIVGFTAFNSRGFLYSGGSYTFIDFPGARGTQANAINNLGVIVGAYSPLGSVSAHGYMLSGGTFSPIDFPGATITVPWGINNAGDIVGTYFDATGSHGFLLTGGVYMPIDYPGAWQSTVTSINDLGQIAGYALFEYPGHTGFVAQFQAVPEPAAGLLLGFGLALLWLANGAIRAPRAF